MLTRREMLKAGLLAAGSTLIPVSGAHATMRRRRRRMVMGSPPVTPFQENLPIPPDLQPVAFLPGGIRCDLPPGSRNPILYNVDVGVGSREIIPGLETEFLGYDRLFPGPTMRARRDQPIVVRFNNRLDRDGLHFPLSTHLHGGHQASESDGFPTDLIEPGRSKDYCYPNIAPDDDTAEFPSTLWYHDHAVEITGHNVYMGLAGFCIVKDNREENLIDMGRLPRDEFDIPIVIQDRRFNRRGDLLFDETNHDGILGDRFLLNGAIQPKLRVERRKYRFRILNGSNARLYELRFSNNMPFLVVGTDSWLINKARELRSIVLSPAERVDIVVDFKDAPSRIFLENLLKQSDGRGPDERVVPGFRLMKIVTRGGTPPDDSCNIRPGSFLRPNTKIEDHEIVRRRRFNFERSGGNAWTINGKLFERGRRDLAEPELGTAEEWVLVNESGGWTHPIHVHLEAMQLKRLDHAAVPLHLRAKKDTVFLGPNGVAKIRMKFRTFTGRFVFHCHNLEHEDMDMMAAFRVRG